MRKFEKFFPALCPNVPGWFVTEVARAFQEGHQIANHSYSHPDLSKLSAAGIQDQINRNRDLLDSICGKGGTYFVRAPFGRVRVTRYWFPSGAAEITGTAMPPKSFPVAGQLSRGCPSTTPPTVRR